MKYFYIMSIALLFSLTSCERGSAERLGEEVDDVARDVGNAVEDLCEDIKDAVDAANRNC